MPNFDASLFETTHISSTITVDDTSAFFREHGIFYHADAIVAEQAEKVGIEALRDPRSLKQLKFKDPRVMHILETCEATFTFVLGRHPGAFYCYAVKPSKDHASAALVYIWTETAILEFFPGTNTSPLRGVKASNGLYQVPYPWCREKHWVEDETERQRLKVELKEIPVQLNGGGILIAHPRTTFMVANGFAVAYGCKMKDASDSDASPA